MIFINVVNQARCSLCVRYSQQYLDLSSAVLKDEMLEKDVIKNQNME